MKMWRDGLPGNLSEHSVQFGTREIGVATKVNGADDLCRCPRRNDDDDTARHPPNKRLSASHVAQSI